jgi:hypothetical protein
MTLPKNISFQELVSREGILPRWHSNILDAMESVEVMEMINRLGDQVLHLMREGRLESMTGKGLLTDLFDAVRDPLNAAERVVEVRKLVKERLRSIKDEDADVLLL